jgi:anti-sigma regulatory factor (Ser/Thr protein kinase)
MPTLSLCVDLQQLETVREFVAETCQGFGLDCRTAYDVRLAVDEACTNVIQHAYAGRGGRVKITIDTIKCGVRVTICDWGTPFDPLAVPTPDVAAPLEERPLGGLGLFLMRQMMDEVDFQFDTDDGNRLTMIKSDSC